MREQIIDEQPIETIHLYVVREDEPHAEKEPSPLAVIVLFLILVAMSFLPYLFPKSLETVTFPLTLQGTIVSPVTRTTTIIAVATGKGHNDATHATGVITFYNGAIYQQIIPVATILTASTNVKIITDEQAVIPSAAQTIPPTYGHVNVSAHALLAGIQGNILAGEINMTCCVSAVLAQNPTAFTGGKNARDFLYLTHDDAQNAVSRALPTLQQQALSLLSSHSSILLNPICTTAIHPTRAIGEAVRNTLVMIAETCSGISYQISSLKEGITLYSSHLGRGTLTHIRVEVLGINVKNHRASIRFFVTAIWNPIAQMQPRTIGK